MRKRLTFSAAMVAALAITGDARSEEEPGAAMAKLEGFDLAESASENLWIPQPMPKPDSVTEDNSPGARTAGKALFYVGLPCLALGAGLTAPAYSGGTSGDFEDVAKTLGPAMLVGGGIMMVVGIPLWIVGEKDVSYRVATRGAGMDVSGSF